MHASLNQHEYSVEIEEGLNRDVGKYNEREEIEVKARLEAGIAKKLNMEPGRVKFRLGWTRLGVVEGREEGR